MSSPISKRVLLNEPMHLAFRPEIAVCEIHGPYPRNHIDLDGIERWPRLGCEKCARQAATSRLMEQAAIPPIFEHCTFENYLVDCDAQAQVLKECRAYADNFEDALATGRCLILRGSVGTGKNHLATAIGKTVLEKGHTVLNALAYALVARIRQSWTSAENELELIRAFGTVDLLVIDEVGKQYGSKGEMLHLFQIIDHRNQHLKPTIVLSNETPFEIERLLGKASYDRLRTQGGRLLQLEWPSSRGKPN